MKQNSKPRNKIFRTIPRAFYLKNILTRLETEYIKILEIVNKYNLDHKRGLGFWSLMRIIFPVIESVSYVVGKRKEDFLESDLQVPFGHLVWEMYRHAIMHTDELRYAVYKGRTFSWATHLGNENVGHFVAKHTNSHPTTIHIDIPRLYYALRDYLINEIAKNDTSQISVQVGVYFPEHESEVINELEELYKNY